MVGVLCLDVVECNLDYEVQVVLGGRGGGERRPEGIGHVDHLLGHLDAAHVLDEKVATHLKDALQFPEDFVDLASVIGRALLAQDDLEERVEDAVEERNGVQEVVFTGVSDERVLVVHIVEHEEESLGVAVKGAHLFQLLSSQFPVDGETFYGEVFGADDLGVERVDHDLAKYFGEVLLGPLEDL